MSRDTPLAGVQACVFDAYGTLFDLGSAVSGAAKQLGRRAKPFNALWRTKQLEYTWLRSLMGRHVDFERVTADALDYALEQSGLGGDTALRADLLAAYRRLSTYREVPAVLRALQADGRPRAILSNGNSELLADNVAAAGIGDLLDAVLSVESVGVFKPHPSVYRLACERLGVTARQVAFFSSNSWDVCGASAFGFRCVWVNRGGAPLERLPGGPDVVVEDLKGVPALLG
jgi:2-haloacid dehalogenase